MDPSLSMKMMQGSVGLKESELRTNQYPHGSVPLTFFPRDGCRPLPAWAIRDVGFGWWDILVDNTSVEDGTPHRIFETRSRQAGPLDKDRTGLFTLGSPTGSVLGHAAGLVEGSASRMERSVDEHEATLRDFSMSLHGAAAREAYMREHGLRCEVGGQIVRDSSRKSAATAQAELADKHKGELGSEGQRAVMQNVAYDLGGVLSIAQQARATGKMFSRVTVVAILRGQYAITSDTHIKDCITIFENLE